MNVLRFNYKNKEIILNVEDTVYTFGNIMTVIDIYFRETKGKGCPSKLRLMVNNENIDEFLSIINTNAYIELDKYGKYIDFMRCYYKVSGYVSEDDMDKVCICMDTEPEESLLEWSDSVAEESLEADVSDMSDMNSMLQDLLIEEDKEYEDGKPLDFIYDDIKLEK